MLRTFFSRQPVLAAFGCLNFIALAALLILQATDPRQLDGVEVWVKPAKFCLSVGVYSLTLAWFFGYVRQERRNKANMQFVIWGTVLLTAFENIWITWQAGHAARSHFNYTTPVAGVRCAKKSSTFKHLDVTSLLTFGRHFRVANSERYANLDRCLNVLLPEPDAARKSRDSRCVPPT